MSTAARQMEALRRRSEHEARKPSDGSNATTNGNSGTNKTQPKEGA